MSKIDNATVQRILDAADIVEVVSDYVSLTRRGVNWIGLCPFHSDRNPSFYVSKAKGICKCFSCGQGGSPLNFIMKIEQMTYTEALRHLARKYNIEIEEREMTDEERQRDTDRENMLVVNAFAADTFNANLTSTPEGRDVGLSYFRHRGINEAMIQAFRLGYALEGRETFYRDAIARGYSEKYLFEVGLSKRTERGNIYDVFNGRVIFPVFSLSGKVVALGGRVLSKDRTPKYVNSRECDIFKKSRELYGLFQAKQEITKEKKCIVVEGYLDVISMHQAGVRNVVATCGTALTHDHVRLIKRFCPSVTLIYDADAAGIKASLRGIEILLQEGVDIKLLRLPPGEDPDSFAQTHTSTEVKQYLADHETDFISFMASILLDGAQGDPVRRSHAITQIVKTIALIRDEIARNVYVQEAARILFMDEGVLRREVGRHYNEYALQSREDRQRKAEIRVLPADTPDAPAGEPGPDTSSPGQATAAETPDQHRLRFLAKYEGAVVRLAVKYGNYTFAEEIGPQGNPLPVTVIDYIDSELRSDSIPITDPSLAAVMRAALAASTAAWTDDLDRERLRLDDIRRSGLAAGIDAIRAQAADTASVAAMEDTLRTRLDAEYADALDSFSVSYISRILCSHPDDTVRTLATDMVAERHILSKVHTKFARVDTERDLLPDLVPRALHELKDAILWTRIADTRRALAACADDYQACIPLMQRIQALEATRRDLAKLIGDRVIAPRK